MKQNNTFLLGIESSCDDTSVAILHNDRILSNSISTQKIHESYGGVVPELASRAHQQQIIPVVFDALKKANISMNQLDAICFTQGPGLMGSLVVGTSFAKGLALSINKPLIAVNHMHGHILAHFIDEGQEKPSFPFLCLTVSGGHTQIVKVESGLKMEILGSTIDDAAGEAFDKIGKILGLKYPGGPILDRLAQTGDATKFTFSKPNIIDFNYSFSGLKTSVLYFIQKEVKLNPTFIEENLIDLCASVQATILDILFKKLIKAAEFTGIKNIAIAGGVSANSGLRQRLKSEGDKRNWKVFIPKFEYCTDNAAMIAMAGKFKFDEGVFATQSVSANPRLNFNGND